MSGTRSNTAAAARFREFYYVRKSTITAEWNWAWETRLADCGSLRSDGHADRSRCHVATRGRPSDGDTMKARMETKTSVDSSVRVLFVAHPHLSDSVNHNIIQSEIEGGVHLRDLPPGSVL